MALKKKRHNIQKSERKHQYPLEKQLLVFQTDQKQNIVISSLASHRIGRTTPVPLIGTYYAGGGENRQPLNFIKKVSASEAIACSLQAHEKTNSPIAWVHASETDKNSVHRAAAARPMDSSRDDPAARRRAQARHPQVVGREPRCRADVRAARGLRQPQRDRGRGARPRGRVAQHPGCAAAEAQHVFQREPAP
jgi:hypothetical protein